jgi:DNA-binding GntR family transcriptional regulator
MANGNFKHGRYSKDLLTAMAARVDEARGNPELLSVSDDIALVEARIAEVLRQLGTGESGAAWQALKRALGEFSAALARGDMAGMTTHFEAMQALVKEGSGTARAWEELRRLEETRCKLVQTEMKTLQGLQQMMTIQQHLLLVSAQTDAVVQAVRAHADEGTGRKILMDVQAEFTRLATLGGH